MDYQQSVKNVDSSFNFIMPINEDYAVFFDFENQGPRYQICLTHELPILLNKPHNADKPYAAIYFEDNHYLHYSYKDSIHSLEHNFDKKLVVNCCSSGYRQDIISQLLELLSLLK